MYKKELEIRMKVENDLIALNKNLETTVSERTVALQNMNRKLIAAKVQAEESSNLKSIFLQNMSHEVRSPLNVILGFAQLIEMENKTNSTLLEYSAFIRNRGSDLLEMIDEILEASVLESGKLPVNFREFYLSELFDEILTNSAHLVSKYNKSEILFRINSDCSINENINTDKSKLIQIITNLIHNAFKFTDTGIIELGCTKRRDNVFVFYVSDTGIGISEENLSHVFERFVQIENYKSTKYGGSGLGLSIVKGLVELLGGEISLSSIPDKGSIFTFSINEKSAVIG